MKYCAPAFSTVFDRTFLMVLGFMVFVCSCNEHPAEPKKQEAVKEAPTALETTTSHTATKVEKAEGAQEIVQEAPLPVPKPVKKPNGIYSASVPVRDSKV